MQDAFGGGWTQESHLTAEVQGSLRDLNHRFLDLAASRAHEWGPRGGFPADFAGRAARLSAAQRAAAADCPYALFDLRFQDDGHWRLRLQNLEAWKVADEAAPGDATVGFVRLAVFYAWHVAAAPGLKAQLLLGMNAATAARWRSITVDQLPALAASESVNLSARWADCASFWDALLRAAARADAAALRRTQLQGLQLAAADRLRQPFGQPFGQGGG